MRIGSWLSVLTLPHFCACNGSGPIFLICFCLLSASYLEILQLLREPVHVCCEWWNGWPSLCNISLASKLYVLSRYWIVALYSKLLKFLFIYFYRENIDNTRMTKCLVKETETLIKMSEIVEVKSVYFGGGEKFRLSAACTCEGGRRGLDRMVVGFTTTYAISSYHH